MHPGQIIDKISHFLGGLFNLLTQINEYLGFEIELVVPVVILVGLLATGLKIRERFPVYKNSLLAGLSFSIGMMLAIFVSGAETTQEMLKSGLYLGSMSSISFQFIKPFILDAGKRLFPWLLNLGKVLLKKRITSVLGVTDKELEDEEAQDE